ncbi:MAG: hypothetical protein K2Y39_26760, partial [Candidatus Obscuribacterales bacterium]|nr:hypothetical protein [Candidatus Obscuribacterales bacterium]
MTLTLSKRDLKRYNIEAHTDVSGSMDGKDSTTGNKTRYQHAAGWVARLVQECELYDEDGVTVGFFNDSLLVYENTTFASVAGRFRQIQPGGSTDTAGLIQARVNDYFDERLGKPGVPGRKGGFLSRGAPDIPAT